MSKKYQIERKDLVDYVLTDEFVNKLIPAMRKDITMGGEFILTAEDLLKSVELVPAIYTKEFNPVESSGFVLAKECAPVYNKKKPLKTK